MLPLVSQLEQLIKTETKGKGISEEGSINSQAAFISLKLLCRHIGQQYTEDFVKVSSYMNKMILRLLLIAPCRWGGGGGGWGGHRFSEFACCICIHLHASSLSNRFTVSCSPVGGDNSLALASGLSYVQVDKYGITILYHLHQCRPCTSRDISC